MDDARHPQPPARAGLSRRRALTVGGALGLGPALAACGDDATTGTEPGTPASSTSSSTPSGSSGTSAGPAPAGTGAALTTVSAVPVGSALLVEGGGGAPVVVAQPTAGRIVAFSGLCTHQGCAVAVAGQELDCPCHGSRFDALTGAVLQGPATDPLTPYEVRVDGDSVVAAT